MRSDGGAQVAHRSYRLIQRLNLQPPHQPNPASQHPTHGAPPAVGSGVPPQPLQLDLHERFRISPDQDPPTPYQAFGPRHLQTRQGHCLAPGSAEILWGL